MRKISVILIMLLVPLVLISGCTQPSSSTSQTAAPTTQTVIQTAATISHGQTLHIIIINRDFDPHTPSPVSVGTTVVWTNEDTVNHRVVHMPELPSDRELFHSASLSKGDTFSYTFQKAGRYYYSDPQYAGGRNALIIVE